MESQCSWLISNLKPYKSKTKINTSCFYYQKFIKELPIMCFTWHDLLSKPSLFPILLRKLSFKWWPENSDQYFKEIGMLSARTFMAILYPNHPNQILPSLQSCCCTDGLRSWYHKDRTMRLKSHMAHNSKCCHQWLLHDKLCWTHGRNEKN